MDPPPRNHLYPAQNPAIYTPMSPYNPPIPNPPAFFYPPSSSNVALPLPIPYNPPIPQPTRHYPSSPIVDPLDKLRNEVIFLHHLWHQGPPHSNSNSNPNFGDPPGNPHPHLKPSHTTAFKPKRKPNSPKLPISDTPWPVLPDPPPPPESASGWPEFPPPPPPLAPILTLEDTARVLATRAHHRAMNSLRSFFSGDDGDCYDQDGASDDDDDDDDDDDGAMFDKFLEVFEGDVELREYYEKSWADGEFLCLVCGATGQKMVGRKYKNCLALVQHTVTVSNTKKKKAHRDYGLVLCKVLGWDINQLALVSRNLSLQQGDGMTSAEACKDDFVGLETNLASLVNENEQSGPSTATSDVVEDDANEKKEASGLPSILDNPAPGDQQGNEMSSVEACKDDPVGVETHNEQSDTSKATSETREDIAAEKESSELPLVLGNPGVQQINDTSNAGTSSSHSDTAEEDSIAMLIECGLCDPPNAGIDTGVQC